MLWVWLHSWKCQHDPLYHCKNTSQQNTQRMTVLPNVKMSVEWHNYSLTLHTRSLHPAEYYPPPGTQAMKGRPTDRQVVPLSLSNGTYPHLSCSRNHANCRHWVAPAVSHRDFVTMNKVAVQISSFMYDWQGIFQVQLLSESAPIVTANGVTTFCCYTYVTIKIDAFTAYLVRNQWL